MRHAVAKRVGGVVCFDLSSDDAAGTLIAALHGARPALPVVGR